jgi:Zn ribbon nucleic-acid-binding protein
MDNIKIDIPVLTDNNGFVGRECPECEKYFKVKFGTGLETEICICPYCQHENNHDHFYTQEQLKYIESYVKKYAFEQILKPELKKLDKSFKDLERSTKHSLLQFKVKSNISNISYQIDYYQEQELETSLTCDSCGLDFSIFGVFATCPDCGELSAITVFNKSIEVIKKN